MQGDKKTIFILWALLFCNFQIVIPQEHVHLIRINLEGKSFEDLLKTGLAFDHGHYVENKSFVGDFSHEELSKLRQFGFDFEPEIKSILPPAPKLLDCIPDSSITPDYFTPGNYAIGTMNGFLNLEELYENLDLMQELYPNLVSRKNPIGNFRTEEGRPIYFLKISDNPNIEEKEPQVLYTALHHAREPASMSQMLFFMWYLLENYQSNQEVKRLINGRELYFIPCLNPDGYKFNQTTNPSGFGYWRKNRAVNVTDYGVDLNRNYGYQWGYNNVGSSDRGDSEIFRGDSPFSEVETKAVKDFCRKNKFQIAINYHSFGNYLLIPWGYENLPTADQKQYEVLAKEFTKYNKFKIGNVINTLNYQANGVSDDWMYGDTITKNKIFAFTPEVGEEFWPERSQISKINLSTQYMNFSAAWNAGSVVNITEVSNTAIESNEGSLTVMLKRTGILSEDIFVQCTTDYGDDIQIIQLEKQTLGPTETKSFDINFKINKPITPGEEIKFYFTLSTGEYQEKIVVTKKFMGPAYWKDLANGLSQWTSPIGKPLLIDNTTFTSEPSSFSDSPGDIISNEDLYVMMTQSKIDLRNAKYAFLSYNIKYDLNSETDFAQVLISTDGTQFHPVCGRYSVPGGIFQGLDQAVYAGVQNHWVNEWINLSDFIGKEIFIQLKIRTTLSEIKHDGFHIDDLKIYSDLISKDYTDFQSNYKYKYDVNTKNLIVDNINHKLLDIALLSSSGTNAGIDFHQLDNSIISSEINLPSGIYFLKIHTQNGPPQVTRIFIP